MLTPWIRKIILDHKKTVAITAFFVVAVFVFSLFFTNGFVFAQDQAPDKFGLQGIDSTIGLVNTDIRIIIGRIIKAILGLLGMIAIVLIIYAGFIIMTSGGEESKVEQGKKILINAVIGLVIILLSYSIVHFVLKALNDAIMNAGDNNRARNIEMQNFAGSGNLGRIVKDHYPFRGETDVPRNARIVVTFFDSIDPRAVIEDTNNSEIYGDCVVPDGGIQRVCDRVLTSAVKIFVSTSTPVDLSSANGGQQFVEAGGVFLPATASMVVESGNRVRTFVFKPIEVLGSSVEPINYTVYLSNNIRFSGIDKRIFDDQNRKYYTWNFETGITFDFEPPVVTTVRPATNALKAKNYIIQVNFNEPVDPTNVQGVYNASSSFSNIVFSQNVVENVAKPVSGEWKISNGYRTIEFIPDELCGQNSCGDNMYCLPTPCEVEECVEPYEILLRTAQLTEDQQDGPFQAVEFTGVMDMSGNALDGNKNGDPNGKPSLGNRFIVEAEKNADNFWWNFRIKNFIDRTSPYILSISPAVDNEAVEPQAPFNILFNKEMLYTSLDNINIEEHGLNNYRPPVNDVDSIWTVKRAEVIGDENTIVNVLHRDFGPNEMILYYFAQVNSRVQSANQGCFYPGDGPNPVSGNSQCIVEPRTGGCILEENFTSETDTGCSTGDTALTPPRVRDINACLQRLRNPLVSPFQRQ